MFGEITIFADTWPEIIFLFFSLVVLILIFKLVPSKYDIRVKKDKEKPDDDALG